MELITPISPERDYANKKIVFLAGLLFFGYIKSDFS